MANYGIKSRSKTVYVVRDRHGQDMEFNTREAAVEFIRNEQEIDREIARQSIEREREIKERAHMEAYFAILQRHMDMNGLSWLRGDCYRITKDCFPEIAKHFGYHVRKMK